MLKAKAPDVMLSQSISENWKILFMRYASQIAGMIFQTRSKAFQHTAGGRNLPCFGCDCGRILESAGILLLRQECEARRRLLAEGELGRRSVRLRNRKYTMPGDSYILERNIQNRAGFPRRRPVCHTSPAWHAPFFCYHKHIHSHSINSPYKQHAKKELIQNEKRRNL